MSSIRKHGNMMPMTFGLGDVPDIDLDEHPSWEDERLPGEFTAIGIKCN